MEWFFTDLLILIPFLLGIGFLVLEVFIPGFGVSGLAGLALEIVSIVMAYNHHGPTAALIITALTAAIFGLTLFLSFRSATKGRLSRSALILKNTEKADEVESTVSVQVGDQGIAVTTLRPAGIAEFNGERLNVMTEGSFIEKGAPVRILKVNGNKIVVE